VELGSRRGVLQDGRQIAIVKHGPRRRSEQRRRQLLFLLLLQLLLLTILHRRLLLLLRRGRAVEVLAVGMWGSTRVLRIQTISAARLSIPTSRRM
jgi:hypothetical protein